MSSVYRIVQHPDGMLHIERNSCSIGYVFKLASGFGCGLFSSDESPVRGMTKRGLLEWVKKHDVKAMRA